MEVITFILLEIVFHLAVIISAKFLLSNLRILKMSTNFPAVTEKNNVIAGFFDSFKSRDGNPRANHVYCIVYIPGAGTLIQPLPPDFKTGFYGNRQM